MTKQINIARWMTITAALAIATMMYFLLAVETAAEKAQASVTPTPEVKVDIEEEALNHRKEIWLGALEWCESRGVKTAINKVDRDGTPSYYSFQFKPSTFRYYGEMYGIVATTTTDIELKEEMKDYVKARKIVRAMIDDPKVNFRQQFPDCVNNKIGLPPRY